MNSYTFSYMFWTDSGQNKLYRSHMDGTNIKTIMDGFVSASGITADYEGEYTSSTLTLRMYDVYTHSQVFYEQVLMDATFLFLNLRIHLL